MSEKEIKVTYSFNLLILKNWCGLKFVAGVVMLLQVMVIYSNLFIYIFCNTILSVIWVLGMVMYVRTLNPIHRKLIVLLIFLDFSTW